MKTALISVYFKDRIDTCARLLKENGWRIISTGGTAKFLQEKGVETVEVSSLTQFPEILDGRVKTLHPAVFGPILAKKSPEHLEQLKKHDLEKIDLVIVNFYPFEESLLEKEKGIDFMIEKIDIGGPSMVRAAAKNFQNTIVVVDYEDYFPVIETVTRDGDLPPDWRKKLAQKAFSYTAYYDHLIAGYLHDTVVMPPFAALAGRKVMDLRYGENPHQQAALYSRDMRSPFHRPEQIQGKELSFNNILDSAMVYEVLNDFQEASPFTVIVKHQNPCGAALAENLMESFNKALAGDPRSAYGGIVGCNRALDGKTAQIMSETFFEVIIAPDFSMEALEIFKKKKNLRLLKMLLGFRENSDFRVIPGGFLLQERDQATADPALFQPKTSRPLSEREKTDTAFGWKLIKYVKSNAIIIVRDEQLLGVGAGQMSRVDSVEIALRKCQTPPEGAVLVSDAYFPFADNIELAAARGITVAVEPGGSVKDEEVVAAAEKHGISLLFTGIRHFRH